MGKQSKSTKKFERNHLKETIDRRKDFAKIKQRHQVNDKRKQRNAQKRAKEGGDESESEEATDGRVDVNQDEYFQEALPLPTAKSGNKTPQPTTGKRKHEQTTEDVEESASAESDDNMEDDDIDMAALAQKDPEFHKYLKENDPELLEFNEEDNLDDLELSEDEEDRPAKKRKTSKNEPVSEELNVQTIRRWKASMQEQHSIRALKEVVLAFRSAAHMDEDEAKDYKYTIPSGDVYHEVLVTALKEAPKVLNFHLPIKETAGGKVRVQTDSSQFKKLSPLIRTFSTSLNHLLPNLSDSATLRLTLQSLEPLLPYLLQFRKFLKQIIRSVASIWSDHSNDESARITAFLILRRLLTIGDLGLKETVLKSTYEHLIKASRSTTPYTLPGINLMKNSAAELWGIDQKISYTASFQFIRQAAMHLRTNITKPTKDSYKSIYNWQFIHSLDFFSRVLSTHCSPLLEAQAGTGPSQLRPLIYPVVQITLGVMRLIPTPTYFPTKIPSHPRPAPHLPINRHIHPPRRRPPRSPQQLRPQKTRQSHNLKPQTNRLHHQHPRPNRLPPHTLLPRQPRRRTHRTPLRIPRSALQIHRIPRARAPPHNQSKALAQDGLQNRNRQQERET